MVAQALAAAMRSVTDGKTLHSMHCYFLRPVDIGAEVRYEVELLRDGRGYSTRQVRGYQNGKPVYVALASFAAGEPGAAFAAALPADIPVPTGLPSSAAYLDGLADGAAAGTTMTDRSRAYWAGGRSFDHAARPRPPLRHRRRRARPAPGGLDQAVRRPPAGRRAHRRAARPGRARLRVRLHDPRAGAARARPRRGPGPGWSRPASTTPCGSTAVPPAPSTTGFSTCRKRSRPRTAAASPPVASSPATTVTWPPSSRKE